MSRQDKERWDQEWAGAGDPYPPHPLLVDHIAHLSGGAALDLACGRGQNAVWLAGLGYRVLGVDISPVALEAARHQAAHQGLAGQVTFEVVDLDEWLPPRLSFDLVIVFRFLARQLFAPIRDSLRPGGAGLLQHAPSGRPGTRSPGHQGLLVATRGIGSRLFWLADRALRRGTGRCRPDRQEARARALSCPGELLGKLAWRLRGDVAE